MKCNVYISESKTPHQSPEGSVIFSSKPVAVLAIPSQFEGTACFPNLVVFFRAQAIRSDRILTKRHAFHREQRNIPSHSIEF